jgi:hypothetical protein
MTEEEENEFIKCASSPIYFLNKHGYVFDIITNKVDRITIFDYQKEVLNNYEKYKNNVILKARQTGLSVITAGYCLWRLIFKPDENILVISMDGNSSKKFLSILKRYLSYIEPWLLPDTIEKNNTTTLEFSNGSKIYATASGKQAGRGETLSLLVLDEAAFIENAQSIWMGAGIALSSEEAKCIMISTPNGTSGLYYSMWTGSKKAANDFHRTEVSWTKHPLYSLGKTERFDENGKKFWWSPWYETQCEKLSFSSVKINQELNLSFEGSADLIIESSIIEKYEREIDGTKPLCYYNYNTNKEERFTHTENTFHVWELPKEGVNYIVACDVARGGAEGDFSTVQVINCADQKLSQAAEYQGKIPVDTFATLIYNIATDYNISYVVIEANSFGLSTCLTLKNVLKYDETRIYHSKAIRKFWLKHMNLDNINDGDSIPGFQTTTGTRPLLMTCLSKYLRDGQILLKSSRLIDELKTFVYHPNNQSYSSNKSANDDLIMALCFALIIRDTEFDNVFKSKEFFKTMLDSISTSRRTTDDVKLPSNIEGKTTIQSRKGVQGPESDLSWLYGPIPG